MHRTRSSQIYSPSGSPIVSRKRTRKTMLVWTAAAVVCFTLPSTSGLAARTTLSRPSVKSVTDEAIATPKKPVTPLYPDEYDSEDDNFEESVSGFLELQQSTGSEILQTDLQRQIDEASQHPNDFLEKHVQGASYLEKVAMSSVTEQLPQAAVQALSQKQQFKNNLNFAKNRVTAEQEVELARIIQQGSHLQKICTDAETQKGRAISRQEWADLAGLSAKELRRQVSNYRKAKHDLVTANIGLVHAVVNQQWPQYKHTGISKEELVQEGSLGLLRAAELFDPERGLRFSTYAVVWIKGTLSNSHVPELVRLPAREKTKWNKIQQAEKDLAENGGKATAEELAAVTNMSIQDVLATQRKMKQARSVLSLDYEYNTQSRSGTETTSMDHLQKDKNFQEDADLAERTQLQADIIAAMARNLDAREARLMRLRYGLSDGRTRSLAECADAMGLSQTRVQQLSQKCLKKLREAAEAESLEEYLLTIA